MRGVTSVIVQTHQILRLPRKMNLMCHTWNAIYNARSNKCHCPNSPNTAPATKNENLMIDPCHTWNAIYNARSNKCHCPNSPNTAPATQNDSPKFRANFSKTAETSFPMRDRSEHDPTMIRAWNRPVSPQPASQPRLLFELTASIFDWKIQHFAPRLTFKNSPSAAPATKSNTWTSPNTAPAMQNDSHDQSSSHIRYLQCAE